MPTSSVETRTAAPSVTTISASVTRSLATATISQTLFAHNELPVVVPAVPKVWPTPVALRRQGHDDVVDGVAVGVVAARVGALAGIQEDCVGSLKQPHGADRLLDRAVRGGDHFLAALHVADDIQAGAADVEAGDGHDRHQGEQDQAHNQRHAAVRGAQLDIAHRSRLPAGLFSRTEVW